MQNNVSLSTNDKDIVIKHGLVNLREQREAAVGSVKYVLSDITDIKKNYFRLGFHLWELQQNKYYEDFGHTTMAAFCEANFDMDKSAVSRCINVFLHVCQRQSGSLLGIPTMFMQEKYQDYSYSQLCEMVSMSESLEKMVKPEMTVSEIRQIKKDIPLSAATIKRVLDYIMGSEVYSREACLKEFKYLGFCHANYLGDGIEYHFTAGKAKIAGSADYYSFAKILDKYATKYSFASDAPAAFDGSGSNNKVATSQQEPEPDGKKYLCENDLQLKGAAFTSKIKSVNSRDKIRIDVYDSNGKFLEIIEADLLFSGSDETKHIVVRELED